MVKIQHQDTKYYLNSEEKQLNSGSGQQIVTFVKDEIHNTLWWIRAAEHGEGPEYNEQTSCQLAEPIRCGTTIRLTHKNTMKNLHSHNKESALSRQQEVTAYGQGDGKGDAGDNWIVQCSGKFWKRNAPVHLKHQDTAKYLGTASNVEFNVQTCGHQCPILNHLEAFGRAAADKYTVLTVEQGIHLSR